MTRLKCIGVWTLLKESIASDLLYWRLQDAVNIYVRARKDMNGYM